jgi:excisionase family DNA binding protein
MITALPLAVLIGHTQSPSVRHQPSADVNGGQNVSEAIEELRREALTISEVCSACGLGRSKVYEAIADGSLKARKAGRRTLVLRDDMKTFLAALPEARPEL